MTKRLAIFALVAMTFAAAPQALKAAERRTVSAGKRNHTRDPHDTGDGFHCGRRPHCGGRGDDLRRKGKWRSRLDVSVNGAISKGTLSGHYTVNTDCTMTQTLSNGTNYDGVVAPDGSKGYWMETDTGTVLSGTLIPLKHPSGLTE